MEVEANRACVAGEAIVARAAAASWVAVIVARVVEGVIVAQAPGD